MFKPQKNKEQNDVVEKHKMAVEEKDINIESTNGRELGVETFVQYVESGWCGFFVKNDTTEFHGHISYMNDFPIDVLDAFEKYVLYGCPPVIVCDEESSDFLIVVDEFWTYIISERETTECIRIDIDREDFIEFLMKDIEENLTEFATEFGDAEDEQDILNRKIEMLTLIKKIKQEMAE